MTRSPPAPMFNAETPALIGSLLRRADSLQLAGADHLGDADRGDTGDRLGEE
jgi:hypothetical protein